MSKIPIPEPEVTAQEDGGGCAESDGLPESGWRSCRRERVRLEAAAEAEREV